MVHIIPILLVGIGAAIMVWNIVCSFSLSRQISCLHFKGKKCSKAGLFAYTALLIFFLIGYIIVGCCFWMPSIILNNFMVSLIFLFGSVFVLLGMKLQMAMSKTIQQSNLEITRALISAVEARDTNLNGHSIHVARLVKLMYSYLPKEEQHKINLNDLEYAALLHDVGKLGVPEAILNKEGSLTKEEWKEIRNHPQIGKNILAKLDGFQEISEWILYHHERCDGKGYLDIPYEQIPLPSRMITVADTFSAITMKRSYREAKGYEQAIIILQENSGTQMDRKIVELFLKIPRQEIEECQYTSEE